jgi:putative ABC transport system substrate-binding protein
MKKAVAASILCAVVLLTLAVIAEAQQTGKIFRIGRLDVSTASGGAVLWEAFRKELSKLGWIEGRNITIEYRFAEQNFDRLPELAAELVRLKVDLIVATGRAPGLAAKRATNSIPIVVTGFPDPVAEGLVASLARPGANVTGLSNLTPELNSKRLEILKDTVPKLARVGYLQQAGSSADRPQKEVRAAAPVLKVKLEEIRIQPTAEGIQTALRTAQQKQIDAILIGGGRTLFAERKRVVELVGKHRFPGIYPQKEFVDEGGLMSYGADSVDLYRRAAWYVDKILKGAKPADLPVQQPTKFEFIVNLNAAKQIGLTIPVRMLERANQVIR